ncbi:hypothetical protein LO772_18675 [Yinghuangia sp. ASG 101]|uniref:hypothetical protein n=1 Tax=Yinghuangia sp. ASG 101 TaxID=2896848 RepID=UPI001E3B49B0|nr:hypothetical protein [Yinghuangia sp. ASG 101]UGQ08999.1 hypothetical protein LO772_18675 [Yinghuangia sp. ASG 101]
MSTAPPAPFLQLLLATSAEHDPDAAARVVARVAAALPPGELDAVLRRSVALPDAFVASIADHGDDARRAALARNLCLTPDQLIALIAAGGQPVVRAVFSPPADETTSRVWAPPSARDDTGEGAEAPGADAVRAADEAPATVDPATAAAILRDAECPPDRALGLLRAHPLLAYTARVPTVDPALPWTAKRAQKLSALPSRLDEPWESVTALEAEAATALGRGAVTPQDLCGRVRPALVAVQTLARLVRSRVPGFPDRDAADALLRPLLARTVGADPGAWARLAASLGAAATPLTALLDGIADMRGDAPAAPGPRIEPPGKARPALLFLIRRLPAADIRTLLPHLDARTKDDLIQGDAPIPADLLELAHDTGDRVLLGKVAAHQHLRDEQAQRVRTYDDIELDRRLVWNRAGLTAALRGEILAGIRPGGGPRRGVDEEMRRRVVESPDHLEPKTLALCGDPMLVCLALAKRPRLRRIDLIDVVLSLWERVGPEAAAGVVTSVPDAFPAQVRKVVDAALAAGSTAGLTASRARWDRGGGKKESDEPAPEWSVEPARRLREYGLTVGTDAWYRSLPARDIVRWGRPAVRALDALPVLCADGRARDVRAALAGQVRDVLGSEPDAWAVFVQLLPEFVGTLPELAELCAAAAHPA